MHSDCSISRGSYTAGFLKPKLLLTFLTWIAKDVPMTVPTEKQNWRCVTNLQQTSSSGVSLCNAIDCFKRHFPYKISTKTAHCISHPFHLWLSIPSEAIYKVCNNSCQIGCHWCFVRSTKQTSPSPPTSFWCTQFQGPIYFVSLFFKISIKQRM